MDKKYLVIGILLLIAYFYIKKNGVPNPFKGIKTYSPNPTNIPPLDTETASEKLQRKMQEDKVNRDKFARDKASKAEQDKANKAADDALRRAKGQSFDEAVKQAAGKTTKTTKPSTVQDQSSQYRAGPVPKAAQDNSPFKGAGDVIGNVIGAAQTWFKGLNKAAQDFVNKSGRSINDWYNSQKGRTLLQDIEEGKLNPADIRAPIELYARADYNVDGNTGITVIVIALSLSAMIYFHYKLKKTRKHRR